MGNQSDLIHNSYFLRTSLITHLFTSVIPLPLPYNHPLIAQCFWSQKMHYETQADLLRLLNLLARHFSAAALSLKLTRSFDATRIITVAAMACICDVIVRKRADDIPSQLSLHYE
jgi:hypothetical protein